MPQISIQISKKQPTSGSTVLSTLDGMLMPHSTLAGAHDFVFDGSVYQIFGDYIANGRPSSEGEDCTSKLSSFT
ncbi:hypothetical protein GALMADRAFT_242888 [Galerina marginata CBS 339.88]|uniref:Uncharacterized protein n=1 Tax=Galerina marginata (strain CBS 339.88) TaxID=685588 RepID=A0A067TNE0_GALM3|nr:hypothetical protein GALMADRAFT_242888 [Galerina marginata CBS 339.88]